MTDIEVPAAPVAPTRTPVGVVRGVLKTMRPRQWVKNVLVFAAPFVGGDLLTPGILPKLLIAFVAFSLAASGIYLVTHDRNHVPPHEVTIVLGERFPPCRGCGEHPRFRAVKLALHANNDTHLKSA